MFKNNFLQEKRETNLLIKDYLLSFKQSRGKKIKYPSLIVIKGVALICLTLLKKKRGAYPSVLLVFLFLSLIFYLSILQFISTKRFCE